MLKHKAVNKLVNKKGVKVEIPRSKFVSASDKATNINLRTGEWALCGDYDLGRTVDGKLYVSAWRGANGVVRMFDLFYYRPLVDRPDLFLKFARLKLEVPGPVSWSESLAGYPLIFGEYDYSRLEAEANAEAARNWAMHNGALGMTTGSPPRAGGEPIMSGGDPMGGESDTLQRFVIESFIARRTLRLYEAATDPNGVDVGAIRSLIGLTPFGNESPGFARQQALDVAARIVERMVADQCHPTLRRKDDGIVQGWGFKNLLGAMWLQMMWLTTADSGRRCHRPGCNRAITIKVPKYEELTYTEAERGGKKWYVPHKYATRKDKIYCSPSCNTMAYRARKRQEG